MDTRGFFVFPKSSVWRLVVPLCSPGFEPLLDLFSQSEEHGGFCGGMRLQEYLSPFC